MKEIPPPGWWLLNRGQSDQRVKYMNQAQSKTQSIFKKAFFSLIPLVVIFFGLELAARALPPIKSGGDAAAFMGGGDGTFVEDPLLKWRVAPGSVEGYTLNQEGFRGAEFPVGAKGADETRILVLGDSTTWGMGVKDEHVWTARLEEILKSRGIVKQPVILNAAVPGYTSFQGRLLFDNELIKYEPDIIITYFGVNDASSRPGMIRDSQWKLPPMWMVPAMRILRKSMLYMDIKAAAGRVVAGEVAPKNAGPSKNAYIQRVTPDEYLENLNKIESHAGEKTKFIHIAPAWWLDGKVRNDVAIIVFRGAGTVSVYSSDGKAAYEKPGALRLVDVFGTYAMNPEDIFSDYCHLKPAGHEMVARDVAARISAILRERTN